MKTGNNFVTIHDVSTGETITREMNEDELAQQIQNEINERNYRQAEADKIAAKASALAKLAALGLTDDEVKAIVG